jgi:lipopolysaccharide transport system ATP-binding protein
LSKPIISVENLSKQYLVGHKSTQRERYTALRDVIARQAANFWRTASDMFRGKHIVEGDAVEEFWALRDVSFEVQPGEVIGIIGRNGAGKSTLLKILSRITEQTAGRITLRGRVASLLEVGTGFHPELTGRENIFLNGAILGMTRTEIKRKFDEIVDFAGVAKFLDTPVKRYSSGMYVRLAFAVAAHLEPEILVVDEVLAVGDVEFQKKCLGKMNDVAQKGRTVLFVSHNLAAVENLCKRGVLLEKGELLQVGSIDDAIRKYLNTESELDSQISLVSSPRANATQRAFLQQLTFRDAQGMMSSQFPIGSDVIFDVKIHSADPIVHCRVAIRIYSTSGQRVTTFHTEYQYLHHIMVNGSAAVRCIWHKCRLSPGRYSVELQVGNETSVLDKLDSCAAFEIIPHDLYGTGKVLPSHAGLIHPDATWEILHHEQYVSVL